MEVIRWGMELGLILRSFYKVGASCCYIASTLCLSLILLARMMGLLFLSRSGSFPWSFWRFKDIPTVFFL